MTQTLSSPITVAQLRDMVLQFRNERNWAQWDHPKAIGLGLFVEAGELAEHFLYKRDHELREHLQKNREDVADELCDVLYWLLIISHEMGFEIEEAFLHKMQKNLAADIQKQYIAVEMEIPQTAATFAEMASLIQDFRSRRQWDKELEPRDLVYKLIEEIGEVAEYFQWRHEDALRTYLQKNRVGLSEEIADCLICVVLLSVSLEIDLETAFTRKMKKNAEKYPL